MNIHRFLASILLGTVLWFGGYQSASAQTCLVTVEGEDPSLNFPSISDAIDTGHLLLFFTGTCPGFLINGIDNVRLAGVDPTSVIEGRIVILSASGVVLQDFTITSVPPQTAGIVVDQGSYVRLISNIVIEGFLSVTRNSGAALRGTSVTNSVGQSAVLVLRNSFLELQQGNVIEHTGPDGTGSIGVGSDSSLIVTESSFGETAMGTQITGDPALRVTRGSLAEIRVGDIVGAVTVDTHRVVSIGNIFFESDASASGNHTISRDSALVFEVPAGNGTVTFNGTATCLDDESSVSGSPSGIGVVDCTGFKQEKLKDKEK